MSDALSNATTQTASVALALFLVTYLSHSTIMLGAAWLISRVRILISHSVKDILYKTALIGSLVTTLIQFALSPMSLLGTWELPNIDHPDFAQNTHEGGHSGAANRDRPLSSNAELVLEAAEIEGAKKGIKIIESSTPSRAFGSLTAVG